MKTKRSSVQASAARRTTNGRPRLSRDVRLKKERDELLAKLVELHATRKQYLLSLQELTRIELAASDKKPRFSRTTRRGRQGAPKLKKLEELRREVQRIQSHCDICARACAVLMWTEDENKIDEDELRDAIARLDRGETFGKLIDEVFAEHGNAV